MLFLFWGFVFWLVGWLVCCCFGGFVVLLFFFIIYYMWESCVEPTAPGFMACRYSRQSFVRAEEMPTHVYTHAGAHVQFMYPHTHTITRSHACTQT